MQSCKPELLYHFILKATKCKEFHLKEKKKQNVTSHNREANLKLFLDQLNKFTPVPSTQNNYWFTLKYWKGLAIKIQ